MSSCRDFTSWNLLGSERRVYHSQVIKLCLQRSRAVMNRHVKTAILALCAVLLVATTLLAQAGKPKAVPVEPIKDAGVVPKGDKVANDFVIRNEGDAPLQITDVRASPSLRITKSLATLSP